MLCGVTYVEIHTVSLGILHIVITAHFIEHLAVLLTVGVRSFALRHGDEGNHIIHLIIISCHRDIQFAESIFPIEREIVGCLRFKVRVAQEEDDAAHIASVLIIELLDGRSLETLAP